MARASLNEPSNWLRWLRAIQLAANRHELGTVTVNIPPLAMLTGQDHRALGAVAYCWHLYASSDDDGRAAALDAIRFLLPAMQRKCRPFARELIAQAMDWQDRDRLWPLVELRAEPYRVLHMAEHGGPSDAD